MWAWVMASTTALVSIVPGVEVLLAGYTTWLTILITCAAVGGLNVLLARIDQLEVSSADVPSAWAALLAPVYLFWRGRAEADHDFESYRPFWLSVGVAIGSPIAATATVTLAMTFR